MALRFLDIASIRRRLKNGGLFMLAALLGAALLACGEPAGSPGPEVSAPTDVASREEHEQHLRDLEVQLEALKQQSEAMRREVVSRLDQIDVTREALKVQLESLRGEPTAAPEATAAATAETRPEGTETPATAEAASETASAGDADSSPFLRFLLLIFILAAIFFLARIFFDRWGDTEDGERPPPVEATTDLGKIRFPPGTEAHPEEGDEPPTGDPENGDEGRPGD